MTVTLPAEHTTCADRPDHACEARRSTLDSDSLTVHKLALEELAAAVLRGQAQPARWARSYVHCCVLAGIPQWFGTQDQRGAGAGAGRPYPIADPGGPDARRALYGLPPYPTAADSLAPRPGGGAR